MDVSLGSSHPGVKLNPHNSSMHSYPEPTCSKVRPCLIKQIPLKVAHLAQAMNI